MCYAYRIVPTTSSRIYKVDNKDLHKMQDEGKVIPGKGDECTYLGYTALTLVWVDLELVQRPM